MAYHQEGQQPPAMSATFVPGGYDDFYMPAPGPELISPAPQRWVMRSPIESEGEQELIAM